MLEAFIQNLRINSPNVKGHWMKEWSLYHGTKKVIGHDARINYALNSALEDLCCKTNHLSDFPLNFRQIGDPRPSYEVWLTRVAPRPIDEHDNLRTGFKRLADTLTKWLFPFSKKGQLDNHILWHYSQERGIPKQYAVKIKITWKKNE